MAVVAHLTQKQEKNEQQKQLLSVAAARTVLKPTHAHIQIPTHLKCNILKSIFFIQQQAACYEILSLICQLIRITAELMKHRDVGIENRY